MANFSKALKILILVRFFNPKLKKYELKIHRRVICHHNEELRKIWRGTDLSFERWHEEIDEFWPEHLKVSKMSFLMDYFWAKHILFELKKNREIILHETEEGYKIWRGIDFKIGIRNLTNFDLSSRKSQKISTLMRSFWAKYKLFELKKYRGLSFIKLKRDAKFGEESTCHFKIDIRNLTNFDLKTWMSQKVSF